MCADPTVNDLLDAMRRLGRQVSFYPSLAKLVGIKEAIFLQQLVYWTPKSRNERGWIYKSAEDLEEETSLTYREQQRVRTTLKKRGLIEERYDRSEHRLYFRVVREAVLHLAPELGAPDKLSDAHLTKRQVVTDKTSGGTLPFVSSYKEQENTPLEDSPEDAARNAVQLKSLFSKAAKTKSTCPSWIHSELEESLYRGIHHQAIERAFFDAKSLSASEQLAECVRIGVTTLVTSRTATLKRLDSNAIERRAFKELLPGLKVLSRVSDFETRQRQTVQTITRVVVGQCVQMLGDSENLAGPGRDFSSTSDAGSKEIAVR
jgi:hypothetical protein